MGTTIIGITVLRASVRFRSVWPTAFLGVAVVLLTALSPATLAQMQGNYLDEVGQPAFSTPTPVELGYVEQANGHLHLGIPLGNSIPQRGNKQGIPYQVVYDSNIWTVTSTITGSLTWTPSTPSGVLSAPSGWRVLPTTDGFSYVYSGSKVIGVIYTDSTQTVHYFGVANTPNAYASDSSGYYAQTSVSDPNGDGGTLVYGPDGALLAHDVWDPSMPTFVGLDANGNYLSLCNSPTKSYCDDVGRTIYSVAQGTNNQTGNLQYVLSVPNSQGNYSNYTLEMATIQLKSNFGQPNVTECSGQFCTATVVQSMILPDGSSYNFMYDCDSTASGQGQVCSSPAGQSAYYGELTEMTVPTGGQINYTWQNVADAYHNHGIWLSTRTVEGGKWTYTPEVITYCANGSQVGCEQSLWETNPLGETTITKFILDNGSWPIEVDGPLTTTKTTWDLTHSCLVSLPDSGCVGHGNIVKLAETESINGPGGSITKNIAYSYDTVSGTTMTTDGLVTAIKEWKFYPGANPTFPSVPDRATYTTWYSPASSPTNIYGGTNIHRPQNVTVCNNSGTDSACPGGGSRVSQTITAYDGAAITSMSGTLNHDDGHYPSTLTVRGLPTQVQKWVSGSAYLTSSYQYDSTGQLLQSTDPAGKVTTYNYGDNYFSDNGTSSPSPVTPPSRTNAFPTKVTLPTVNGVSFVHTFSYYYGSGKVASSTDFNGQTTHFHYMDPFDRATSTVFAIGWNLVNYTSPNQADVYVPVADAIPSMNCTSCRHEQVNFDELGRKVSEQLVNGPGCASEVDTTYDVLGRVATKSLPYCHGTQSAVNETYSYDALDRVTQVTHPDGSTVHTTYSGAGTEVSDEGNGTNGIQGISQTDGLGRLTSVCEVTGATQMGGGTPAACGQDIAGTGFLTTYQYDVLGNLLQVNQGGMTRSFVYDALSRLVSTTNPESGTTTYTYDADGNVLTKKDARGITTTYTYDALNRLLSKTYSDGTPAVTFTYDQTSAWGTTLSNSVGRLTLESADSGHAQAIFSYDPMGRVVNNTQCTPYNCGTSAFSISYSYDVAGDMLTFTNGAGVTFTQAFNAAAQLTKLTSSLNDANHPSTLLSNIAYNAFGSSTSDSLGNGLNESRSYTTRGWLASEAAGAGTPGTPGTPGTGTVTVNGTEQSHITATQGKGSVSISGTEQSVCPPLGAATVSMGAGSANSTGSCPDPVIYDSGTISIVVNGYTATVSYGQGSTSIGLAQTLAGALTGGSSPVTATANNGVVSLTSIATGTAANYSLSASSSTNDPGDFSLPSFEANASGTTLTGGTNGTTTYDSGTVSITVNGFTKSASYGQGGTPSSIAAALAAAFNGAGTSSPVTARASGGVVTLTSKAIGSASNFALSSASSGSFNPASFNASCSGASLTGGTDATGSAAYAFEIPASGYAPDGDILQVNDTVNGNWTYTYDDFNRLAAASGPNQAYTYGYDRYGNRWQQNLTAGSGGTSNLTFSGGNNRMDGYSYDAAGNLLGDGVHTYTYDAENRIVKVDGGSTASYVYNAEGQRVRKTVGATSVDYLYDLAGHQITELSSTGAWNRGEVYAGGRYLATYANSTTYFHHRDWLGTERARTAMNGAACETIQSLPFGDGESISGTCGDTSPMHFTGKQRDSESGLDNFGARYLTSSMGRFMTPDWSSRPSPVPYASVADPQTLNLYSYVLNNPLSKTDPNGHDWFYVDKKWQWQKGHVYHDKDGNATKAKGYAGLLVATATGTDKKTGTTTYNLTLYNQNKVVATGTGFSGNNHYADTPAIKDGNYQILGRFDPPPTAPNPSSPDNNPPPVYGYQRIDPSINSYAEAVYEAYGPMRARLNPLDPSGSQGAYFHGQFGDAFHSEGWTHGCLSYGRDTTMIDYMSSHFGNTWTGVSVDTQVEKPQ